MLTLHKALPRSATVRECHSASPQLHHRQTLTAASRPARRARSDVRQEPRHCLLHHSLLGCVFKAGLPG